VADPVELDFLREQLERAWRRVDAVEGPRLGDAAAPLPARVAAFGARIEALRQTFDDDRGVDRDVDTPQQGEETP
jgi:hypothetical protein